VSIYTVWNCLCHTSTCVIQLILYCCQHEQSVAYHIIQEKRPVYALCVIYTTQKRIVRVWCLFAPPVGPRRGQPLHCNFRKSACKLSMLLIKKFGSDIMRVWYTRQPWRALHHFSFISLVLFVTFTFRYEYRWSPHYRYEYRWSQQYTKYRISSD